VSAPCDRCAVDAVGNGTLWTHKDGRELVLCTEHTEAHKIALVKQGFEPRPVEHEVGPAKTGPKSWHYCSTCSRYVLSRMVQVGEGPWVKVMLCAKCDTRTCGKQTPRGKCDDRVTDREQRKCKHGHDLMVEAF
jgi:hypothetical protein